MAAIKGRLMVLGVEDSPGAGTYTDIGSSVSTTMTINNSSVDITDIDSNGWVEMLEGAGEQSVTFSINGVLKAGTAEGLLTAAAKANSILKYQLTYGSNTAIGNFQITSFEISGEKAGAVQFSASLSSSGTITFA